MQVLEASLRQAKCEVNAFTRGTHILKQLCMEPIKGLHHNISRDVREHFHHINMMYVAYDLQFNTVYCRFPLGTLCSRKRGTNRHHDT